VLSLDARDERSVVPMEFEDVDQGSVATIEKAARLVRLAPMEQVGCVHGVVACMSNCPPR